MSVILLVGVPGSGKTVLANNLKKKFDEMGKECVIVSEPSVEQGTFDSSDAERIGRSDFKNSFQRELSAKRVVIADGMNFIKGYRYELFCLTREAGLSWCVAFCDVDDETAFKRSEARYPKKDRLRKLIGRMERPRESTKFDKPLFVVTDPNDEEIIDKIIAQSMSKNSVLIPKKATNAGHETAHINDKIDQVINDFCNELQRIQGTVPLGSTIEIQGAKMILKKQYNTGQLKRAKREFTTRAKAMPSDANITQIFADLLEVLYK